MTKSQWWKELPLWEAFFSSSSSSSFVILSSRWQWDRKIEYIWWQRMRCLAPTHDEDIQMLSESWICIYIVIAQKHSHTQSKKDKSFQSLWRTCLLQFYSFTMLHRLNFGSGLNEKSKYRKNEPVSIGSRSNVIVLTHTILYQFYKIPDWLTLLHALTVIISISAHLHSIFINIERIFRYSTAKFIC